MYIRFVLSFNIHNAFMLKFYICFLRVPDQNIISRLHNMLEIYHSGPEPLICFTFLNLYLFSATEHVLHGKAT